jgi:hypothetical protein
MANRTISRLEHNAIAATIAATPGARDAICDALRDYRSRRLYDVAKELRRHIYFIGYPIKR